MSTYPQRVSLEGLAIEIFKLVSRGATPEQWAEWLRAPLEHAAAQGNHGLVDNLLGAGADGSAGWKGCGGRTLLQAAAVGGSEGVVSSLLRAGAQPEINVARSSSPSPLYLATSSGHEAAARLLIHAGADVNFVPKNKRAVLHEAVLGRHERLAKELMMSGADVEALDSFGSTPLHLAAEEGLDGVVSALLLRGVDKDAVNNEGYSALMLASGVYGEAHLAVVETLLPAGADLNIRRSGGYAALDWASLCGHVPIIQAILRHGADVNSRDINGHSTLHKAAINDKADSVDALIEAGADMEMKTNNAGRTPLTSTAGFGKSKALLALLQKGAVISAQDNAGYTPLGLACRFQREGIEAVVDMLLRWGADETALANDGNSPENLLRIVHPLRTCSADEIECMQLLLARAPADRAWRRRGWLVMLRSRASRANANDGGERAEKSNDAAGGVGESCKVARIEGAVGVAGGEGRQAGSGAGEIGNEMVDGVENEAFGGAVVRLVGLEPEGVFRTVLEFL